MEQVCYCAILSQKLPFMENICLIAHTQLSLFLSLFLEKRYCVTIGPL